MSVLRRTSQIRSEILQFFDSLLCLALKKVKDLSFVSLFRQTLRQLTYFLTLFFSGTQHYCPPEFYSHHCFLGSQATVWQLGFLLAEMLTGEMPFVKPRMALYMHPSIPKHISRGKKIFTTIVSSVRMLPWATFLVSNGNNIFVYNTISRALLLMTSKANKSCLTHLIIVGMLR